MQPKIRTASVLVLLLLLGACGPQYKTFTTYNPPADAAGRQCLVHCGDQRQSCRQQIGFEKQQCRLDAQREAQNETFRRQNEYQAELIRYQTGQRGDLPSPPDPAEPEYWRCDSDERQAEERCTQDYDQCYQNCGGRVVYETRCVANCEDE